MRYFRLGLVYITVLNLTSVYAISDDKELLKRGEYLVESVLVCTDCHYSDYSGGMTIKEHTFSAKVPNITQDVDTGIGGWSDEQIMLAIREGIRPNGTVIGYPMPILMYRSISDYDLKATVAYLRTIKPISKENGISTYPDGLPDAYGPPVSKVDPVDQSDKLAYGEYLAKLGHCIPCHTPADENFKSQYDSALGAGGTEFILNDGAILISANLTPAGSLPNYSDEGLKNIIRTGIRPDGSKLVRFMDFDSYAKMTDEDLEAIVVYLRNLKPVE